MARSTPRAPGDLDAAGRAVWRSVWRLDRVEPSDRVTVERLCRLEDEAARLRAFLADEGLVLKRPLSSARGDVIGEETYPHPAIPALRKIGTEAGEVCRALGLSPGARKTLGLLVLADPTPPDSVDDLRERRRSRRRQAIGAGA
jgi:P27 family predicted phage terminase small subunit